MGWCSGTGVFDMVCNVVLVEGEIDKDKAIITLIRELEDSDWDCQSDSIYWDHPVVRKAFLAIHPDWDWDAEDEVTNEQVGHSKYLIIEDD